jgi:ribosomal protein S18 acetylase RimI-like enzyme
MKDDNFDLVLAIPCYRTKDKIINPIDNSINACMTEELPDLFIKNPLKFDEKDLGIKNIDNKNSLKDDAEMFCKQIKEHGIYELIFFGEAEKIKVERNPFSFGQVVLYEDKKDEDGNVECCYNFFAVLSKLTVKESFIKKKSSFDDHIFNIVYFVVPDISYHDMTLLMDQSHELTCLINGEKTDDFTEYLNVKFGYNYFGKIYHIIFSDSNQFNTIMHDEHKLFNILAAEEYKGKDNFSHQIKLSENTNEYILYSEPEHEKNKHFSLSKNEKFYDDYNMYISYKAYASIYAYYYIINEKDKDQFHNRIWPDSKNENFSSEGNILFILETEIFKITACLVSSMKINEQINKPNMEEIETMFKNFINTRPLFEKFNYRYLGAQKEADFINKQFRISDIIVDYDRKRELLKNYCEVHTSIITNLNSKILNCLGLVFALIAGWEKLELLSKVIFVKHIKISDIWDNELIIPISVTILVMIILIINLSPIIRKFIKYLLGKCYKAYNSVYNFIFFNIIKLNKQNYKELQCLFSECFENDSYYSKVLLNTSIRKETMDKGIKDILEFCLKNDGAYGVFKNKKLIGFLLLFNYHKTKKLDSEQFETIFKLGLCEEELPYKEKIHDKISSNGINVIYLLSIGVAKKYRRRGIAKKLIDFVIKNYKKYYIVSDVSNLLSMGIYKKRNFECEKIDENYFLVVRKPT